MHKDAGLLNWILERDISRAFPCFPVPFLGYDGGLCVWTEAVNRRHLDIHILTEKRRKIIKGWGGGEKAGDHTQNKNHHFNQCSYAKSMTRLCESSQFLMSHVLAARLP